MEMISSSSISANNDDNDEPLLKKLGVFLCMIQNAPWLCKLTFTLYHPHLVCILIGMPSLHLLTLISCGKNTNITLAGKEEVGREKGGRGRREIYHRHITEPVITFY